MEKILLQKKTSGSFIISWQHVEYVSSKNDRKSIYANFICATETRTLVDRPTETEQNVSTSFCSVKYMHVCHI